MVAVPFSTDGDARVMSKTRKEGAPQPLFKQVPCVSDPLSRFFFVSVPLSFCVRFLERLYWQRRFAMSLFWYLHLLISPYGEPELSLVQ